MAKKYSSGQTAGQGGDLGLYKRGALAKVLEDQTFGLKTGETTAPIRTRQGFVLLKVTNHVAPGVPALKDIEPQIEDALYSEEMQPALRAYLTKLRDDAYVDVKPGFVDSGASPNQTKPIYFTSYTAPAVKKKPEKQKQRFDRSKEFSAAAVGPEKKEAALTALRLLRLRSGSSGGECGFGEHYDGEYSCSANGDEYNYECCDEYKDGRQHKDDHERKAG